MECLSGPNLTAYIYVILSRPWCMYVEKFLLLIINAYNICISIRKEKCSRNGTTRKQDIGKCTMF